MILQSIFNPFSNPRKIYFVDHEDMVTKLMFGVGGVSFSDFWDSQRYIVFPKNNQPTEERGMLFQIAAAHKKIRTAMPEGNKPDEIRNHLLGIVEHHLKQHGTLDELAFCSHGTLPGRASTLVGGIGNALDAVAALGDKLGVKPAKRIVFTICNGFRHLSIDEVSALRNWAKTYGVEVVGALGITSLSPSDGKEFGHFIKFTPEGNVERDSMHTTRLSLKWNEMEGKLLKYKTSKLWFECHKGVTQECGAERQRKAGGIYLTINPPQSHLVIPPAPERTSRAAVPHITGVTP